ncbi:hypothetical protein GCM10025786_10840 [Nocardioides caeni]
MPIRATESVISWMANGWVMPARSSASQICGMTPRSRKVGPGFAAASVASVVSGVVSDAVSGVVFSMEVRIFRFREWSQPDWHGARIRCGCLTLSRAHTWAGARADPSRSRVGADRLSLGPTLLVACAHG